MIPPYTPDGYKNIKDTATEIQTKLHSANSVEDWVEQIEAFFERGQTPTDEDKVLMSTGYDKFRDDVAADSETTFSNHYGAVIRELTRREIIPAVESTKNDATARDEETGKHEQTDN